MVSRVNEYTLFIASPGDLGIERETVRQACEALNRRPLVKERKIRLDPKGWEDVLPGAGRPQDIINRLQQGCDIFVCMFHRRYGTPTGDHDSGTAEEFFNAYDEWKQTERPEILFYFKEISNLTPKDFRDPQIQGVMDLREKIETEELLLYGIFDTPEGFAEKLGEHLEQTILKLEKGVPSENMTGLKPAVAVFQESYRAWLTDLTKHMDIKELTRGCNVINVKLPEIYQPLFGDDPDAEAGEGEHPERPKPVDIQVIAGRGETLLVTGVAGCGKTTLARYMARTVLNNESPHFAKDTLPLLIYFKDLKQYEFQGKFPNASEAEEILAWFCKRITPGILDMETIRAFCESGKILVILDGLDEADSDLRDFVAASFADFRHSCKGLRLVLLGRPHGAAGKVAERFGDRAVTVQDLTNGQAENFIQTWFTHAYEGGPYTGPDLARKMISEIRSREDIDEMKKNPLMLTAMCILYNDAKVLPEQRADLYHRFVERLLSKFDAQKHQVRKFLMESAHTMFTDGDRGIDERDAVKILAKHVRPGKGETVREAFRRIEPATGLTGREAGRYKFIHLTFQEFLTAQYLHDHAVGDPYDAVESFTTDPRYREVLALFIGLLSLGSSGNANAIVRRIMDQGQSEDAYNWITAAQSLLDIHRDSRDPAVTELSHERMRTVIRSGAQPKVRLAAGEALGRLGYRPLYPFRVVSTIWRIRVNGKLGRLRWASTRSQISGSGSSWMPGDIKSRTTGRSKAWNGWVKTGQPNPFISVNGGTTAPTPRWWASAGMRQKPFATGSPGALATVSPMTCPRKPSGRRPPPGKNNGHIPGEKRLTRQSAILGIPGWSGLHRVEYSCPAKPRTASMTWQVMFGNGLGLHISKKRTWKTLFMTGN